MAIIYFYNFCDLDKNLLKNCQDNILEILSVSPKFWVG